MAYQMSTDEICELSRYIYPSLPPLSLYPTAEDVLKKYKKWKWKDKKKETADEMNKRNLKKLTSHN